MSARSTIAKASPLVKGILGMLGVPREALAVVDTGAAIAGLTSEPERIRLAAFVEEASARLEVYAQREYCAVRAADKEAIDGILVDALAALPTEAVLAAALQGGSAVRLLVNQQVERGLNGIGGEDLRGYVEGLLNLVCGLVQAWPWLPEMRARATQAGVGELLRRTAGAAGWQPPAAPPPALPTVEFPVTVGSPPPLAAAYQDRHDARTIVDAAWRQPSAADDRGVTCVLLTGDGGVGKTQLAAGIFRRAAADTDVRVWVTASTAQTLVAGLAEAADRVRAAGVGDPDLAAVRARGFLRWLEDGPGRDRPWLVVLDDLGLSAQEMVELALWPPQTARGRVIVTTRSKEAAFDADGRARVRLDVYTPIEAVGYLTTRLQGSWPGTELPSVLLEAPELAEDLGRLPVALAQAAAVLIDTRTSCAAYRQRFADRATTLGELFPAPSRSDGYAHTVATTWSLAIDRADEKQPAGFARPASHLAAVIDPAGCPRALWTTAAALAYLAARPGEAESALAALHTLSVVTLDGLPPAAEVRIHPLAQRAIRDELVRAGTLGRAVVTAADALAELWPPFENDRPLVRLLQANAVHVADVSPEALLTPDAHPLLFRAGKSLGWLGLMAQARDYFEALAEKAAHHLGPTHRATLQARSACAYWRGRAGDPTGARGDFDQLVTDCRGQFGPDDRDTLAVRANLARFTGQSGNPADAVAECRSLRGDCERVLGLDDRLTLLVRHNLAHWLAKSGDVAAAVAEFERVLSDRQRLLGNDHPDTLLTRNDLAYNNGRLREPGVAVAGLEAVLADRIRVLGPDHPETLLTRTDLAKWRTKANEWVGAVAEYEALLADDLRIVGPEHSYTLRARLQLALARGHQGARATAVVADLESVLADCRQALGPGHPTTQEAEQELVNWRSQPAQTASGS